ncbi:hypothetical protein ACQKLP_05035 [Chitinophaga sp. NPDC101104]|uniref:hypothetical protein n=1 Tax=Chitinophaga sp. NPDC101104 TaxID=3390561 RepID=UPI003CFFF760
MGIGNFAIGYHGCDMDIAELLLNDHRKFFVSDREHEWLGHGMYFWENNLRRGMEWANLKFERQLIRKPAVIGALLNLRNCCDFSDQRYLNLIRSYHGNMKEDRAIRGRDMPVNFAPKGTLPKDIVARNLDCAAIEHMHEEMEWLSRFGTPDNFGCETKPFDSVRGLFIEGQPVFDGSGIYSKSHIQICIRNPECIVGFFKPRADGFDDLPGLEVRDDGVLLRAF